jgi:hypothetical protein
LLNIQNILSRRKFKKAVNRCKTTKTVAGKNKPNSTQRIGKKLGKASDDEMEMILEGLNEILGN